ncbi:site-specific integrase [Roseovarius spongiae]|nr:site-specific integrase [Roseovarius spongiae]
MPHVPAAVVARMQDHLRQGAPLQRGMPAVLEDFHARLEAAGLAPEQAGPEIFRAVGASRSRFRCLVAALRQFAPETPLAASIPVKQEWDHWLNERYNKKAPAKRVSRHVGLPPEAWPESWQSALACLDRSVRPYGTRLRKLAPRTRAGVISAVGLLARSREWAADRGVEIPALPSGDLFAGFLHYLEEERAVSFGTARDYLESARMFFLRAGLFDEASYEALADLIAALAEEAAESDPGKWARLREFRTAFSLADPLKLALACSAEAKTLAGNSVKAAKLRQKAMIYALLVNTGDRQGDLRFYRIDIDLVRDAAGDWRHGIRQGKTGKAKEVDALWPGASALIDSHILGDRPEWRLPGRLAEIEGMNLLTLSDHVVGKGYINRRLAADFDIHGHLVRTLIADLIRRTRPEALWALQAMLGHTDRHTQKVYRSEFDESKAVQEFDALVGQLSAPQS